MFPKFVVFEDFTQPFIHSLELISFVRLCPNKIKKQYLALNIWLCRGFIYLNIYTLVTSLRFNNF